MSHPEGRSDRKETEMYTIRRFRREDIPFIAAQQALLNELSKGFDETYYAPAEDALEEFTRYIGTKLDDEDFGLLVAESEDGKIIGYQMGWMEYRPRIYRYVSTGYMSNTYIDVDHRRMGIGDRLVESMEEWFESKNVDFIVGRVDFRNERMLELIRKRGYRQVWVFSMKNCIKETS